MPSFHYLTRNGEVLLLQELIQELQLVLEGKGIGADALPLTTMIQAMREVTEAIAEGQLAVHSQDELFQEVGLRLRRMRVIIPQTLLRDVLLEYMRQLERFEVVSIHYY